VRGTIGLLQFADGVERAQSLSFTYTCSCDLPCLDGSAPVHCRQWRQNARLKQIPFVFYTATHTNAKDEAFGLSLGAGLFLVKPTEPTVLRQKILDVLQRYNQAPPRSWHWVCRTKIAPKLVFLAYCPTAVVETVNLVALRQPEFTA
jgi:DNA-binding response OmpR family regulator